MTTGLLPTVSGIQRVPKPRDSILCAAFAASEEVSPSKKYQTPNFPVSNVYSKIFDSQWASCVTLKVGTTAFVGVLSPGY